MFSTMRSVRAEIVNKGYGKDELKSKKEEDLIAYFLKP